LGRDCRIAASSELTRGNRSLRALGFRTDAHRATATLLAQAAQVALEIARYLRGGFKLTLSRHSDVGSIRQSHPKLISDCSLCNGDAVFI
jgi:hypothetical protein